MESSSDPAQLRTIVEATSDSLREAETVEPEPEVGPEIGRYLVIDEIGAGGMGRVFRAYDPKLGREVALKRLRLRKGANANDGARMLREAKAMALLAHPNVVSIYDVDIDQGSLFIAMEYVRGVTLKTWIVRTKHDWREVIAMFVQAARGLAAAHAQGIVHRDFKPSNVVVGEDLRPRVMDFGLARAVGSGESGMFEPLPDALAPPSELDAFDSAGASRDLGVTLTAFGTVVGTPPYMAPEQHLGETVDARTDQYAFCVALWEGLYRTAAFPGRNLAELAAAKLAGAPKPPAGTGVPSTVQAIVTRGLAVEPSARWPDMTSLVAALEQATAPPRRGRWVAAAVAGAALLGGAAWWSTREQPCTTSEAELADTWGASQRAAIEQSMRTGNAAYADSTITRVEPMLDAYAQSWVAMHAETCAATKLRHEQSELALELRMACLAAREQELGGVVELLATADAEITEHAILLVSGLTPVGVCDDVDTLRKQVPPPEQAESRAIVDDVRARVEQAQLRKRAGRLDEALPMVESARADALASGYAPLVAEVDVELGTILSLLDRDDEARVVLERAFDAALRERDDHTAAAAAVMLSDLLSQKSGTAEDSSWLARTALGLARGDGSDARLISRAMRGYGEVFASRELELEAEPWFAGAVAEIEEKLGPEHPEMVPALLDHAELVEALGRQQEAVQVMRRALAIAEDAFGPDHPMTAHPLTQLGFMALDDGRFDDALVDFDRAYAIELAAFGPDHSGTWASLGMRAAVLAELHRYPESIRAMEEVIGHMRATLPDGHPNLSNMLHNLSRVHSMQGDHERALDYLDEAVRMRRKFGHKGVLASGLIALGRELRTVGRFDEAESALNEGLVVQQEAHRDDGKFLVQADIELAELDQQRGQLRRARERLERKHDAMPDPVDPLEASALELALAKVLWELGEDRARATALARKALARLEAAGIDHGEQVDELRAWLDSHARVLDAG